MLWQGGVGMKPNDASGLARATCAWLTYRSLTGFKTTLSESMLSIPISEFLAANGWKLEPELSYRDLLDGNNLPDFWCDFAGDLHVFHLDATWITGKIYAGFRLGIHCHHHHVDGDFSGRGTGAARNRTSNHSHHLIQTSG